MGAKLPPFSVSEEDGSPTVWQPWQIKFSNGVVTDNGDGTVSVNISAGTGGAPTTSTYITQTPDGTLTAEQALNQLNTGLLKNASGTGVLVIASGGVDYENILSAGSPLLRKVNLIYLNTDGSVTNFLNGAGNFVNPYEARSPLLKSASILSILTDGITTNFLRGDGVYAAPPGGIVYAPSNATYIVQTPDNTLSNEQALNQLLTGLVKNTSGTGVLSIASAGVDYESPLTAGSPLLRIGDIFHSDTASSTKNGFLLFSDWNNFNAKAITSRAISTTSPLGGGGDLSADRTFSVGSLSAIGGATYIVGVNTNATAWEYKQFIAGANITITHSQQAVTFVVSTGGGETIEARTPLLKAGTVLSILTDGATTTYLRGDGTYRIIYEARSPFLSSGTILSLRTDGSATNFLSGLGNYIVPVEARSPLLKAGSIMSVLTDGTATNYLRGDGTYRSVYEARSPLLSAGTILSVLTDGSTNNFLRGDGSYAVPSSNSGVKIILFTVYSDQSWTADSIPIAQAPFETPITVRQVNATVAGGGPSEIGFNIDHRIWGSLGTTGTNLFAAIQSANTTGFQAVSFNSASIPAKAHIVFVSSAVIAGNVDYITGAIYYTRDSI